MLARDTIGWTARGSAWLVVVVSQGLLLVSPDAYGLYTIWFVGMGVVGFPALLLTSTLAAGVNAHRFNLWDVPPLLVTGFTSLLALTVVAWAAAITAVVL